MASRFETLSYILLSPIFFASIGLTVELPHMTTAILLFSGLLLIVAILTKIVGCGFGARLCKYSKEESMQIGVGMISRGEVALIVANKGSAMGLMNSVFFGPIIIVVIATTIITPILLKLVFQRGNQAASDDEDNPLVDEFNETERLEIQEQHLIVDAEKAEIAAHAEKRKKAV
jgi:Kef-type K+ transport system membrane component KefB